MDEEEIVAQLAPTLRRDLHAYLLSKSVERVPLFSMHRSYGSLELQLHVEKRLKPLLREAKEQLLDATEKGAPGGPSVLFLRRGTVAACSDLPDTVLFEIDATIDPGAILGEHTLFGPAATCICSFRAKTRCELFTLGLDDLRTIASMLRAEPEEHLHRSGPHPSLQTSDTAGIDEMASLIYSVHAKRLRLRAFSIRLLMHGYARRGLGAVFVAPLRLQARWLKRTGVLSKISHPSHALCSIYASF